MNDYIKEEDAESGVGYVGIDKDYFVSVKEVLNITAETGALETQCRVRDLPPADVVEVVRCKNCEHWKCNPNTDRYGACQKVSYDDFEVVMEGDDFCSYGERKE